MSTASLKQAARLALVISFSLHALSASAKDFTERDFRAQALGHGVYELAYDNGQKTLYAASAPSFDKDKTADWSFDWRRILCGLMRKSLPNAAPSRSPWMKKITSCIWVTRWMAR
ncbi:putative receptor [Klebsiella michiganensis]|uniref:Putative receptor n=1 Tax=Klebsiella michiganensis TaxID=1134687 RepID=A0A7H4LSK6_9ENTR|nr:putative receptor [Klebsiella michiganensis]